MTAAGPAPGALAALVPATLAAIARLEAAGRDLDPETLFDMVARLRGPAEDIAAALARSRAAEWPEGSAPLRDCVEGAAAAAAKGLAALAAAGDAPDPLRAAYAAAREAARAAEAIYPLAPFIPAIGEAFLEPRAREDAALRARIAAAPPGRDGVGTLHLGGPPGTRGGASLYIPEYLDPDTPAPLIVALHGGSGNGGAFLWSWMREARSRGCLLIAPTAAGRTWSLADPTFDGARIEAAVAAVAERWTIDPGRRLLTGMSDGGTFTYTYGMSAGCPFTHLAPVAAAYNAFVLAMGDRTRLRGLPIRIAHGARDWMFPVETAEEGARALAAAGAAVAFERIPDLAHAYPREANAAILDWFLGG